MDGGNLLQLKRPPTNWLLDPRLRTGGQAGAELYLRNALDRGHLVRRTNVQWGDEDAAQQAGEDVHHYTNATPQIKEFNQRTWLQLEDGLLRFLEDAGLKASIFSGPVVRDDDPVYRRVKIPLSYWKILVVDIDGEARAVGYVLNQSIEVDGDEVAGSADGFDIINSQVSIRQIEVLTGLDFGAVKNLDYLDFSAIGD
ncbi:DNA/RNA non-specific endonuclease [Sedimentitalea sp.]|uniref:DNA/RNA non-specific endonuclease n=1 Tax=Sedimentitalea sp. TaxID=2048915 RepID=UPI0032996A90